VRRVTDFRHYEHPLTSEVYRKDKLVYKDVHDIENTHTSYTPTINGGIEKSETEPDTKNI